jgi:hypothetical protein
MYLLMYNLWSKRNYVINMWCQPMDSSILKNLWQARHENIMNKKTMDITLSNTIGLIIHNGSNLAKLMRQMWTFIFNMKKSFKSVLMKNTKGCVSQDGSWRMINKDLAMMNHASEKIKPEAWRRGTRYDGERQVDVWIRGIKLAMESHISLSVNLYWIIKKRWHG